MHTSRHRANLSVAASVDLDVEGGGRLDEDYDGGWSSTSSAWSATGPAAYTSSMGVVQSIQCHLAWAKRGISDANRWPEAARVTARSPELRKGVVKGLVLSASITVVIFFFELVFFPTHLFRQHTDKGSYHHGVQHEDEDDFDVNLGSTATVFWLYPLIAGAYLLAASWTLDVAHAAHKLKHGHSISSATQGIIPQDLSRRLVMESYRVILVANYAVISFGLQYIPWIGRGLAFFFMSFIDAYYCFEQTWIARGWSVDRRMRYAESRWAYFMAFGLPSTLISFFHPSGLLNLMLFMLVFPLCTVLAMLANPQPRVAPTGQTTLTPQNSGLPPSLATNATLSFLVPPRLPIFWVTIKLYRLVLRLFPQMMDVSALATHGLANGSAWRSAYADASGSSVRRERNNFTPFVFGANGGLNDSEGGSATNFGAASAPVNGQASHAFGNRPDFAGGPPGMAAKRGAAAAHVVNGAWNGQSLGASAGAAYGNSELFGQGMQARSDAALVSANGHGAPYLLSQNGGNHYGGATSSMPHYTQPLSRGTQGKKKE